MKKFLLPLAVLSLSLGAQAQTLFSEDFENGNTGANPRPIGTNPGWTTIDSYKGANTNYAWGNYYRDPEGQSGSQISGANCAHVSGPIFDNEGDGANGPREEVLLSPKMTLDGTYQLSVSFEVSPMNAVDRSRYDFQVRVLQADGDIKTAPVVFTIQDPEVLRNCGVVSGHTSGLVEDWAVRTAKIDLSAFAGLEVQLAFVFKMQSLIANSLWIDDIKVEKFTPAQGPVAKTDIDRVAFPTVYVGEKAWSDPITLTNIGQDGLKITSIDFPAGVSSNLPIDKVNLRRYDSLSFNLAYSASLASATSGNVTLHTTGGDVVIAISGSKEFVPEGFTLETFEGHWPPAGWTNNGWSTAPYAIEGDRSVSCDGNYTKSTLRSPRLDLIDGGKVIFTYYNQFIDESEYPEYDIELQLSIDGGQNWKTKWTSDYQKLNELLTDTIDLGTGSDNCYIQWVYPAVESDDEGAFPHSFFYMDRLLLPTLFGADGVPGVASNPTPKVGTENVYPFDVTLTWEPAQFAQGYKLYLGTTSACNEVFDGLDLGKDLSVVIPKLDYATNYRWKIIPYNDKGDTNAGISTWTFSTQPDATIREFPYIEDFDNSDKGKLPIGWISDDSKCAYSPYRQWSINTYKKYYDANGKAFCPIQTIWLNAGESNNVTTPECILPADKPMEITFVWGDGHPSDLQTDPAGIIQKQNVEPNNGISELRFEIFANGQWTELTTISENAASDGKKYWINERVDLSTYAGQTVKFRWTHYSYSGRDGGGAVARICIEEAKGDKVAFNKEGWNAGCVNYQKAVSSGEQFTLFNHGSNAQKISKIEFATPNFETTLKVGDEIPASGALKFALKFNALDSQAALEDEMTLTFESGLEAALPVSGIAEKQNTRYYSFEPNDDDYIWTDDFTMIDKDRSPNFNFSTSWIHFSAGGQKGAFSVESDDKDGTGLYGMMKPISGTHALVAASPAAAAADNWLISRRLKATADSKFSFYGRNMDSENTILPDPKHELEILVSTKGNTEISEFQTVLSRRDIPYCKEDEWNRYEIDLGQFDGQNVYVALRHLTPSATNLAFFDDLRLENFLDAESTIEEISTAQQTVEVYNLSGQKVASATEDLPRGLYIVKTGSKTLKIKL